MSSNKPSPAGASYLPAVQPKLLPACTCHRSRRYDKWGADLERVRARVRSFCLAKAKCYSEEVELELAYLRIRATRPRVVYEISPYYGYSSLWLLSAVKDNGEGRVISFDVVDYSVENIPDDLKPLHTFVHGDARELHTQQPLADYLFLDSMHSKEFGEFFTSDLFARHAGRHVYVSLHDVYNPKMWSGLAGPGRDKDVFPEWMPTEEGLWVLTWLAFHNEHCHVWTPAPSCPHTGSFYADVLEARARVVTSPSVYARDSTSTNTDGPNPTIFFELNCEQAL